MGAGESGSAELRLLRESLESFLAPPLVSAILNEALAEFTGPPRGESLMTFVRGPLREAVVRRVGQAHASAMLARLEVLAERAANASVPPTGPPTTPPSPAAAAAAVKSVASDSAVFALKQRDGKRRDRDSTLQMSVDRSGSVTILSGANVLERAITGHGTVRAKMAVGNSLGALAAGGNMPALVVIDCMDFPAIEPSEIARAIENFPDSVICVLWASDLPYGKRVSEATSSLHRLVRIEKMQGIEPLLDLIRARSG